ncbi:hypothetical protein [Phaeacidiphilus oryzae]|uniref:hypothetical protein n=1 Tax=Phaeacidiphilus oryzae TaxID=348818 RepID=UPI000560BC30|nr:hypothetical protein [Phaeacidiphilus oryzae]
MTKGPNTRLADLFALTGWSKGELARMVNRRGAAIGQQQLSTDTSRVRRWMERGEIPRDPVPRVLAALFTERLGRVVTIEDLGFQRRTRLSGSAAQARSARNAGAAAAAGDATGAEPGAEGEQEGDPEATELPPELIWQPEPRRTAEVLTEFTGMDLMLNRRGLMGASAGLVAGTSIAAPLHDWMAGRASARGSVPTARRAGRDVQAIAADDLYAAGPVGSDEVDALERSVLVFRAWDAARGGGLQRKAVIGQLNEVSGMLTYSHPPHLARRLWTVAANLSVLAGWMSHDVGMEPTAQHYFVMAVHAARQADDRPRAGEALSRAARQMVHLGRADDALDIMRVAEARSGDDTLPRTRAMLRTVEAWAHASLGHSQATRRTLGEAEDLFAADRGEPGPDWLQFFNEADLHGMEALTYRTLAEHDPSAAALARFHGEQAIGLRENSEYERSKLFDYLSVASAYYLSDEPEQAGNYAKLALNATREMSSHRTRDRLRQMYRLTGRFQQDPEVRELREQIRTAIPAGRPQVI